MEQTSLLAVLGDIDAHYQQTLTLESLAQRAGVSPTHLQKCFVQALGISPKQYQHALRMRDLRASLRAGRSVTDAIYTAGFGSSSRFYEKGPQALGMAPKTYAKGAPEQDIYLALCTTAVGIITMAATAQAVCYVGLDNDLISSLERVRQEFPLAHFTVIDADKPLALNHWILALQAYLEGELQRPVIPIEAAGTLFQIKVWRFLTTIPEGETRTYQQIADAIGAPSATRAVGNACGRNRVAVLIPCHRALRKDGGLGGFRWGEDLKRHLLRLEGEVKAF